MKKDKPSLVVSEFVKALISIRKERGLSHEALAQKSGLTRPAISHIEHGRRRPSLLAAIKITRALGVNLSDVLKEVEKNN